MSFWLLSEKFLYLQCGNFQWSHNFKTYKLNRCLNHHLDQRTSYYNLHWDSCHTARTYPIVDCSLWWAKTAYGESLRFCFICKCAQY